MMVQVELEQWTSASSSKWTTLWLDEDDKPFKEGDRVTLKGEPGWWLVKVIHSVRKEKKELHSDWRVGGLT